MPDTPLADSLYDTPLWMLVPCIFGLLLIATYIGWRMGHRVRDTITAEGRSQYGALQGAMLGMLGLLLGFTLSMAVGRHDERRRAMVSEANAVGTLYLRSRLLGKPLDSWCADRVQQYASIRLEAARTRHDSAKQQVLSLEADRLQWEIWTGAMRAVENGNPTHVDWLFTEALNSAIDAKSAHEAVLNTQLPLTVIALMVTAGAVSLALMGYVCGLALAHARTVLVALALLVSMAVFVILDLDRPKRGLIRVSVDPMSRTVETIQKQQRLR